jgi:hypothetical protein
VPEVIGPGHVFIGPTGQDCDWTYLGRTEGYMPIVLLPAGYQEDTLARALDRWRVTLTAGIADFWTSDKWRWLHDLDRACYPRRHRRCHVCHPEWSRPLAVNGHEYRRRQLARIRRKR